jgi:hypothetical protein
MVRKMAPLTLLVVVFVSNRFLLVISLLVLDLLVAIFVSKRFLLVYVFC